MPPDHPAPAGKVVMMSVLTLLAAEFLVCPAVADPVSALKAAGYVAVVFLVVFHMSDFEANIL